MTLCDPHYRSPHMRYTV